MVSEAFCGRCAGILSVNGFRTDSFGAKRRLCSEFILPDEDRTDLGRNGLFVLQKKSGYRFAADSVLLARFAGIRMGGTRTAELGAGCGVISVLFADSHPAVTVDAVEIDAETADMARRSVLANGMEQRVRVCEMDLQASPARLGRETYDLVLANPPYWAGGIAAADGRSRIAKTQAGGGIRAFISCAAALLKERGYFTLVYPAAQIDELFQALGAARLPAKRARLVQHNAACAPKRVLAECVKGASGGIRGEPTLMVAEAEERMAVEQKTRTGTAGARAETEE